MLSPIPTADDLRLLDPDGSFVERLAADLAVITRLAESGRLEELGLVVHRLAGAAGTFGFTAIGDLAIALDEAIDARGPLSAADAARLAVTISSALKVHEKSA